MSKNPPDWWARIFGLVGILIGVVGLVLNYFNNRWQQQVYAKSQEERVFVQLSAEYILLSEKKPSQAQLGVTVEVVNLGMQPLYLKSVTGEFGDHGASFYKHDPLNAKEPMRRLEPGEAADYTTDWESVLENIGTKGVVEVETTKKRFTQPVHIDRVTVSADIVELLPLRKRLLLPPPLHPK